ncbi:MAG: D-aminoacylase [Planctomycetota bacterium]|nr:D-aminoacylase [Planctomycetota bacterium]
MFDVIIRNGQVIDGTGKERFSADVGIVGDKVVKVGDLSGQDASRVIDADGLIVAPGFIDMHAHEYSILADPHADSKLRQGVTTEVQGNCGMSLAPAVGKGIPAVRSMLQTFGEAAGKVHIPWSSMAEHLDYLDENGLVANYAMLVGHGTARASVMGFDNRAPSDNEMKQMKQIVSEAMEEGAWGLSSGLIYLPALYSKTDELVELAKVAAEYGGIYTSHIRGEHDPILKDAIAEAIEIGRQAKIPVEISHFKAYGKGLWGRAYEFLKMLDDARTEGVDINADAYPYIATHTMLRAILPGWVQEGGNEKMIERLVDHDLRNKARQDISDGNVIYFKGVGWDGVRLVRSSLDDSLTGKNISEIAEKRGKDPCETAFDLLVEEPTLRANYFALDEDDVRKILKHPLVVIGSDSYALADQGPLAQGRPHPRCYGTFPRVLGKYSREEGLFPLEQAVRKMTSMSAQKIGLTGRGVLEEGAFADIAVFNPETVADRATYENPHQYPDGIPYVLVNGRVVVENGDYTGELAGKVLRHKG